MSGIIGGTAQGLENHNYVWDTSSLAWVSETQPLIKTDSLTVSGTMDLTKIGGVAVGATNGLYVQPATSSLFPVSTKTALTPSAPTAVSVGVTSGTVLAANASRKGLYLVNTSANYISLGFGAAAVLYSGITLNPSGGSFWMSEYDFTTLIVYGISSGDSSNLSIQEYS
jgi:hypothetical protein